VIHRAAPGPVGVVGELVMDRLTPEHMQTLAEITDVLYEVLIGGGHVPPIAALDRDL
jgi:hypothetical protein